MDKKRFKPESIQKPKEQTPRHLGFVRNILEAVEKMNEAEVGDAVTMSIDAGSFQVRDEFVNDFRKEFKRLGVKVRLETHVALDRPRGWYDMTIIKER